MREASQRQARSEQRALTISIVWMLVVQLGCIALWHNGLFDRQAALIHWLLVGVLPPALALWGLRHVEPERAPRPN